MPNATSEPRTEIREARRRVLMIIPGMEASDDCRSVHPFVAVARRDMNEARARVSSDKIGGMKFANSLRDEWVLIF